jgi:hypothetical protein
MTRTDQFDGIAEAVRTELASVTRLAHINTFHPGAFDWTEAGTQAEREFTRASRTGRSGFSRR